MLKPLSCKSVALLLASFVAVAPARSAAQEPAVQPAATPGAPTIKAQTVEIAPQGLEVEIGQQVKFTATAKDTAGKPLDDKPTVWFATPFDTAAADTSGTVTFYEAGEAQVGAVVRGKAGFTKVMIKPARVVSLDVAPLDAPVVVGGTVKLAVTPRAANGNPRGGVNVKWMSETPSVATVDPAGMVIGIKPGKAVLRATSEGASGGITVEVVKNDVRDLTIEPRSATARTGDVVRFTVQAKSARGAAVKAPSLRWSVSGEGARIEPDGGFVAEQPGTYTITAASGERLAVASVVVQPRNAERELEVVGRALVKEHPTAEQWIIGNYAYLSSIADKLLVYDIADPAHPKLVDTVKVDARITNDISTTVDGRIAVLTREGASNRRNGIVFLDTTDPAHPKVISEYTQTVTGGVHSAFVDGTYVYLTDDATGSMRVVDFKDVKNPKEVARWETPNPLAKPIATPFGEAIGGRYLHDLQVKDGLAYLAYWRDGLIILDVGNGMKGGSPEKPQLVGQLRFNYTELYGPNWLAGAHAVYRYKNYVFVGDEVFPSTFDLNDLKGRVPARGIVHVVDVSDIANPRKVAEYVVPEAGSHNMWIDNDILYMGYYGGGGRVLDVSGELRGDLYRQGREIARLYTGDRQGYAPNVPFTWGAQPHRGMIFFNDVNSGLWIVKLGKSKDKGSTTAAGY